MLLEQHGAELAKLFGPVLEHPQIASRSSISSANTRHCVERACAALLQSGREGMLRTERDRWGLALCGGPHGGVLEMRSERAGALCG
jgi:hypothetical protein